MSSTSAPAVSAAQPSLSKTTTTIPTTSLATGDDLKKDELEFMFSSLVSDEVSQTKLIASLLLFFLTLLCGYLPVRTILNQRYIQYAIFAGGGVLMATAFCHIIPEAHDNFKLSTGLGQANHHHHHQHHINSQLENNYFNDSHISNVSNHNNNLSNFSLGVANDRTKTHDDDHDDDSVHQDGEALHLPYVEITICCGFFFIYLTEMLMVRFINIHTHTHPCDSSMSQLVGNTATGPTAGELHLVSGDLVAANATRLNSSTTLSTISGGANNRTTSSSASAGTEFYKFIRGFLIVSAFIIHSLFDGIAIGSQETVEKVWAVYFAISCHKLIIAAVVGFELFSATLESHLWTLVHLSIFSIMSPLGIILVVIAQNSLHIAANDPIMILLQAFAAGTLLYIVFIEILQPKEDQASEKNKIGKSVCLVTGFALMTVVLIFTDVD